MNTAPLSTTRRLVNGVAPYALATLGGVLVAVGLPPLGWWPTVIVGIACYFIAVERANGRGRTQFVIATLFAWSWLAPAMGWMWHLVPSGFVIAPLLFSVWHGLAAVVAVRVAPGASMTLTSRLVVRAAMHAMVECVRTFVPFGGVPLAGLALGVADTRLAHAVRLVGPLGLALWILLLSAVVAEFWLRRREFGWQPRVGALVVLGLLVAVQALAQVSPRGSDSGQTLRIAAVQGGGEQGVFAVDSNPRDVIERHLAATRLLDAEDEVGLVVWPENAIDVDDFTTSNVKQQIVAEARRIGAPFAVGVTEDAGDNFTNAQIVVDQNGDEISRYDKVRRVPYGEYVPLRSLLDSLGAPVDRIPRDAVSGTARAILDVPMPTRSATLAVAISWEVFFPGRVDDGVAAGGEIVLNPTNGSSYTGEILQQQQVAMSQLRALESGRFVVQAATTGYSVIVDPDGHVLQRIPIGKQAVIFQDLPLRRGRTAYSYLGDVSILAFLIGLVTVVGWRARRSRTTSRRIGDEA